MAKLHIGDFMPDFSFDTAYRKGLTVAETVKAAPLTVFWVLRYIGCTVCRYDVHILSQRYEEFRKKGAQICVVMQSAPETVRHDLENAAVPFEIICDQDLNIYRSLSIEEARGMAADVKEWLGKKAAKARAAGFSHGKYEGLEDQLPAMFITDSARKVLYAHYASDIRDMPDADEVLKILDTLK